MHTLFCCCCCCCFALLAEGDLSDVCREVVGIESRYYQFGIALGLLSGQLDSIRTAYYQLIDQAFYQVLLLWLRQSYDYRRHDRPTWRRLVEAVDSPNGGNNPALAIAIANRHTVPGMISLSLSLSLSPSLSVCLPLSLSVWPFVHVYSRCQWQTS